MLDQLLVWAVVILPTMFALGTEVVSKEIKEHPYWRVGVFSFGIGISALTWFQVSHANKTAIKDRESAIIETAVETSKRVNGQMKQNMTTSLEEYNSAHPQHPVTSEQLRELKTAIGGIGAKIVPPVAPLKERALGLAKKISDFAAERKNELDTVWMYQPGNDKTGGYRKRFDEETLGQYRDQFMNEALEITHEFEAHGVGWVHRPYHFACGYEVVTLTAIQFCAMQLSEAAGGIKQKPPG